MIYNEVLLTRQIPGGNANRHIFCAAGNNKKIVLKTAAFRAKLWYVCLLPRKKLIQWPRNAPTARAISASGQMVAERVATPRDTTRKPVSASSKTSSKCIFATKKHRKPKFSMLFGAAGRIRTADLILTNGTVALLKRIIAPQNPRFKSAFHCFSRHFVPYRSDPFYSNSSQIVVKKQVV